MTLQKSPAWRSKKYLEWIRTLPCCCGNHPPPSEPHHIKGVGHFSGGALKASDILAMPVSRKCHDRLPNDPVQYEYICRTIERAVKEGILVIYSRGVPGHD